MHDPDVRGAVEVVVALFGALTLIAFVVRWVRLPLSVALVSFGLLVAGIAPVRFTISPDVVLTALVSGLVFEAALRLHLADLQRIVGRTTRRPSVRRRVPRRQRHHSHGTPTTGETLCASLGAGSNAVRCGTVQTAWRSWTSETAGYTVWGGDMSYTTVGGDSGSPVYRRLSVGGGEQVRAIGVNDHENGYFARLDQSLDDFGAVVFQ